MRPRELGSSALAVAAGVALASAALWETIWFSRDGSFAEQLGLDESETPWVFVVDPSGRVALSLHAEASPAGAARVLAAVGAGP